MSCSILRKNSQFVDDSEVNHSLTESETSVSSSVSFENITIREYSVTIGDNPSCSSGAPISIDWYYSKEVTLPLNSYEASKPATRERSKLKIPRDLRHKMLTQRDIPFTKIVQASQEASQERERRARSGDRFYRRTQTKKKIVAILAFPLIILCSKKKE
mmetsp:Transcript_15206/g.22251  ORF Transcript_15206/g.22251 Transcript_15206/m.22251 type:complete len:159 (-) Transcript_15206:231-707(-)